MSAQYYNVYVGEINASGSAVISTNHPGTLESIKVEQGARVKKGEVLAEVVSKNVLASYEISHATLRQVEDGYERVKKVHKSVYDQMARFNAGLVPISDVLMKQTSLFEATENLINKQIEYSKALTAYNGRKEK